MKPFRSLLLFTVIITLGCDMSEMHIPIDHKDDTPEYRAAVWEGVAQRVGHELTPLAAGTVLAGIWDVEDETFGTRQPIFRYEFGTGSRVEIFLIQGDQNKPTNTTYAVPGEGRLTMWDETFHAATTPAGELVVFNGDSSLLLIATKR